MIYFAPALSRQPTPRQVLDMGDHDFEGAPQHHPDLVSYIRQLHLVAPKGASAPYALSRPNATDFSQNGQSKEVEKVLKGKVRSIYKFKEKIMDVFHSW